MSDDNDRVAWPIVEALDAAAVRLKRENADLRAMLREIRRTVIASVRGEEHAAALTDEEVDAHAASTPVDVGNLVARMRSTENERDALSNFSRNNEVALASAVDQLALLRAQVAALTADRDAAQERLARMEANHALNVRVSCEEQTQRKNAAQRVVDAIGHELTCHTTLHPDDPWEGCSCVVADVERGCMGDVVAWMLRERDAVRAIIAGRTTPPSDAEIAAHHAAGGEWLGFREDVRTWCHGPEVVSFTYSEEHERSARRCSRFWPLDAEGRPCAWPVVEAKQCE